MYFMTQPSPINGLYAITPDDANTQRLLRSVRLALQGGAQILQYRNKLASSDLQLEQALALRELTQQFSVPFIINDDVLLAKTVGADGVHLGAADGEIAWARTQLGSGKLIGASCYNRLELARSAVQVGVDYIAFGAFFQSGVKPDAVKAELAILQAARAEFSVPIVAIGGITVQNAGILLAAGADGLAVISAIFSASNIEQAAQEFSHLF